jgi:hypothetical protein
LAIVASLGILIVGSLVTTAASAWASSGIGVFVGYADTARANATNFPTPWAGSPNTIFEGCVPAAACEFDAGAVRIVNNSGAPVTVNAVAVRVGSCTFTGWPSAVLVNGADLIVTQMAPTPAEGCYGPAQLDSSDIETLPNCTPNGLLPTVALTINGTTTTYTDSGQVLNTGGIDAGVCLGNESIQWTAIGHAPCRGSLLGLTPPTQTRALGMTAVVTATFTNSCGQPLSNVLVNFVVQSGPNGGRMGTGVTDANGTATFSYSGVAPGTDTLRASVTNRVGTIQSNTVAVTWVAFASGGGAFVISDLKDVAGGNVYWWGAQWWKNDPLSQGLAPASFKGFENSNRLPACGSSWTTRPGNSSRPPQSVAANSLMAVIVSSQITKRGPTISGNIVHIVVVRTNPGYGPNPGHPGTGTVVATLC